MERDAPLMRCAKHFKSHLKKPSSLLVRDRGMLDEYGDWRSVVSRTATAKENFVEQQLAGRTSDCHRLKSPEQTTLLCITREEKLEVVDMG